ncbi:NAD(P)-binding protein [Acaryochloris marina]|uniref:Amine oxidase domain-containing protein n=1 Tax=Acaryochloris marina (strain MBIC 11017) TaxID=329726 RepID=B0BZG7_ACAM1|nr:NAD(P)-binding protein [Acaryochloris marina]ABW30712.1 hypothetical protein AM1_5767 [Acaryochloris marina MBIC11017]BDM79492.1 hypothetical protein AM10699_23600 [Acaryochloris marina MBIC10699]
MNFAIVGGGITGLIAAKILNDKYPNSNITLIEKANEMGGILAGTYYKKQGIYFDKGTHIFRETGYPQIDDFILSSIPKTELIHFDVHQGDIAGAVFDGKLQSNSHFPDIRKLTNYDDLYISLSNQVNSCNPISPIERLEPLITNACSRFGELYTKKVLAPILSNLFQRPAEDLASFSLLLPGLTRIVCSNYLEWLQNAHNIQYREIFAVPDQRKLPNQLRHGKRSFYSHSLGSRNFVKGITANLESKGVQFLQSTTITSFNLDKLLITCLTPKGESLELQVDGIVLATGVFGAAQLLDISMEIFSFDQPILSRIINLIVKKSPESDLCYFYGLDPKMDFYRVTNYRAFSGNPKDRRLSIEVLGNNAIDNSILPQHVLKQLFDIGFISHEGFEFGDVVRLKTGFPTPTISNMQSLVKLSDYVHEQLPNKVLLGGIGAKKGLFFQNEIIKDISDKILERF